MKKLSTNTNLFLFFTSSLWSVCARARLSGRGRASSCTWSSAALSADEEEQRDGSEEAKRNRSVMISVDIQWINPHWREETIWPRVHDAACGLRDGRAVVQVGDHDKAQACCARSILVRICCRAEEPTNLVVAGGRKSFWSLESGIRYCGVLVPLAGQRPALQCGPSSGGTEISHMPQ